MYNSVRNGFFLRRGQNTFLIIEWKSGLQSERLRITGYACTQGKGTTICVLLVQKLKSSCCVLSARLAHLDKKRVGTLELR